jgi:hypothetical protein
MTHTRTRAGFFERTAADTASVWLSHAGTNQDFYLTLPLNRLDHFVKDGTKHPVAGMYGIGIIKHINEEEGIYAFEAVIDGHIVLLIIKEQDIAKYSNKAEAVNV